MIQGYATLEGTAGYFNALKELGGWLEGAGLHSSRVGLGGYRIDNHTPAHSEAIKTALLSGCNLIDTSTNYTDGESELAIGKAIGDLIHVGVLDRDQVILVSKVGYVQGAALGMAKTKEREGTPFPEMVKYQEGCWHCIHPEFLAVQIEKSLERLGVSCLDFYLLHNPEYFLMDAVKKGAAQNLPALREQFYDRVRRAFDFLEGAVADGKIRGYGVSSNTLGAKPDKAEATSASRFLDIANEVATLRKTTSHFWLLQLPLNLFESGPYLEKNTGPENAFTALEFASKHHIAVLANRPLNAFSHDTLIRLADFPSEAPASAAESLAALGQLEQEFANEFGAKLKFGVKASEVFRWSQDLAEVEKAQLGVERWSQIEEQILFHTSRFCAELGNQLPAKEWNEWTRRYDSALRETLKLFRSKARQTTQEKSSQVSAKLDPFLPLDWQKESLSRKALGVLIHTPGVSSALNGMRNADYVVDSLGASKLPRLSEIAVRKVFAAFS
jgi:uncharacterized protein